MNEDLKEKLEYIVLGVFVIIYFSIIYLVISTGFDNTLRTPLKMFVIMWLLFVLFIIFGSDIGKYMNIGCDKEKQPIRCDTP